ncbi:hypothetical protein ACFY9F_26750 [Streptomyces sp. NPDC012421]|uniref:hypothetical protein n=1 Tax=Streptomyces sp. NPDC012421 TaxID=3364832 RepID=UPI0036EB1D38
MNDAITEAEAGTDPVTGGARAEAGTDPVTGGARAEAAGPAAAAPLGVPREPTGLPSVDALVARLAETDHLPADGHLAVYEDVHQGLRAELTSLDARPAPAPRPHDPRS